jgi:hypothetical protein
MVAGNCKVLCYEETQKPILATRKRGLIKIKNLAKLLAYSFPTQEHWLLYEEKFIRIWKCRAYGK